MLGATKKIYSEPGTIRGDFCIDVGRNVILDLTVSNLPIGKLRYGSNQRSKLVVKINLKNGSMNEIFEEIKSDIRILCLSEADGILIK